MLFFLDSFTMFCVSCDMTVTYDIILTPNSQNKIKIKVKVKRL